MRALVIIPTYNERENIDLMVGQIEAVGLDLDCLFVDDGSPDGTGEKIVSISRARPWIRLLQRGSKKGIGSAHLDGISWARGNGYQTVITMDCDLTHSPSDIPAMLKAAEDADVVVGSRYMRKGSLAGWNWYRKALTRTAHLLTRFLLGIRHDSTGAFRIYRLDIRSSFCRRNIRRGLPSWGDRAFQRRRNPEHPAGAPPRSETQWPDVAILAASPRNQRCRAQTLACPRWENLASASSTGNFAQPGDSLDREHSRSGRI